MQNKISKSLLIVNHCMDISHPALAHQSEVALALANNFNKVFILTGEINGVSIPSNVQIYSYKPKYNLLPIMIIKFSVLFLYLITTRKIDIVFSHMSSRHSALMGPILKASMKKHVLWYAHKSKPFTLIVSYFFINQLVTSTKGSCPIEGSKVLYIGQSIDESNFDMKDISNSKLENFVHIGRFDPSKDIDLIISEFLKLRRVYSDIKLTIIGNPSDTESLEYKNSLEEKYFEYLHHGVITFQPSVKRTDVGKVLTDFDVFLHAFRGSLDKTLLEATLVGLPVITLNLEYTNNFGTWCTNVNNPNILLDELLCLKKMPVENRNERIQQRRALALKEHTLSKWIEKLTDILGSN
jgi:glycosyltransferase involved in cell wall biosynthesis